MEQTQGLNLWKTMNQSQEPVLQPVLSEKKADVQIELGKLADGAKVPSNAVGVVGDDDKILSPSQETQNEGLDEYGIPKRA